MPNADEGQLLLEVPQDHAAALANWLSDSEALRGRVRPVQAAPKSGQMGATLDVLTVALGSGGIGVALVRALCSWLGQRRQDITITLRAPDGRQIRVDARQARDPESLIRSVASVMGPDDPDWL